MEHCDIAQQTQGHFDLDQDQVAQELLRGLALPVYKQILWYETHDSFSAPHSRGRTEVRV